MKTSVESCFKTTVEAERISTNDFIKLELLFNKKIHLQFRKPVFNVFSIKNQ